MPNFPIRGPPRRLTWLFLYSGGAMDIIHRFFDAIVPVLMWIFILFVSLTGAFGRHTDPQWRSARRQMRRSIRVQYRRIGR